MGSAREVCCSWCCGERQQETTVRPHRPKRPSPRIPLLWRDAAALHAQQPVVRRVAARDWPGVVALFQTVLPHADYTVTHPAFARVEEAFVGWKLSEQGDMRCFLDPELAEGRVLFVAELRGRVVGMSGVVLDGGRAELVRMQVLAAHRGAGLGLRLLHECERWASERGAARMVLETWVVNVSGQRWYERQGYAKVRIVQFELAQEFERLGLDRVDGLTVSDLQSWEMQKALLPASAE